MTRLLGTCAVAGVVLLALRLAGVIAWPWALVLAPFWVPAAAAWVCLATVCVADALPGRERDEAESER